MRKMTSEDRLASIRLSLKRRKKWLKRNKVPVRKHKKSTNIISAPIVFELLHSKNHRFLVDFLNSLRETVLVRRKPIKIDFTETKRMVVCGTLLFYSELCSIKKEIKTLDLLSCIPPKDETVAQVLEHLGIFSMLGCRSSVKPERADVINWKIASGENTDATDVGKILESQSKLPASKSKKIFRGVSEAMTNVSQHAYLNLQDDRFEFAKNKGWWMFCREEDDHIFVAICDLGVGIPVTLPKTIEKDQEESNLVKILLNLFGSKGKYSDGELIQAAIEVKRSRTKKRHRGKGLLDMIKAIETTNGRLAILSNKGGYLYNVSGKTPSEDVKNYKDSINGTLILWSLPLIADTEVKA
jgi:hypothetical protein